MVRLGPSDPKLEDQAQVLYGESDHFRKILEHD